MWQLLLLFGIQITPFLPKICGFSKYLLVEDTLKCFFVAASEGGHWEAWGRNSEATFVRACWTCWRGGGSWDMSEFNLTRVRVQKEHFYSLQPPHSRHSFMKSVQYELFAYIILFTLFLLINYIFAKLWEKESHPIWNRHTSWFSLLVIFQLLVA